MIVTDKQLAFIRIIEGYVSEKFLGSTKEEASAYISSHIDAYRKCKAHEDAAMNLNMWALNNGY